MTREEKRLTYGLQGTLIRSGL